MRELDYTRKGLFTKFIPTHMLQTENEDGINDDVVGEWVEINNNKQNFLEWTWWVKNVHSIVNLSHNLIVVIFKETFFAEDSHIMNHRIVIYKGRLE